MLKFCLLSLLFCTLPAYATVLEYSGEARDINSGKLLYTEWHTLTLENDRPQRREVRYISPQGQVMAQKENRYGNPMVPEFSLQDFRRDYYERLELSADKLTLQLKEPGEKPRQGTLKLSGTLVADAGFDELIRARWPDLVQGDRIAFNFVSVSRLSSIGFAVEKTAETDNSLIFTMRLSSALLAWLLDPIELEYDKKRQRLLRFRGLTNITDEQGNHYSAEIRYVYP